MRKTVLIIFFFLTVYSCFSQASFTSIEQAKYSHGDSLEYVSKSTYLIELSFHVKDGYILLENKDLNVITKFINVVPGKIPNTWRAFSKETKTAYMFSFIINKSGMCVVMDDQVFVYFLKVYSSKRHN